MAVFCVCCVAPSLLAPVSAQAASPDVTTVSRPQPIHAYLDQGRADEAIALLNQKLSANANDANAHNLLCRVYYQEERWPLAVQECEKAVHLAPGNSMFHLWLGRAYGESAEHSSLLTAFNFARKLHAQFETAVQLDPANVQALSDIGEYYVEAPAFLGGGLDHARAIATQLAPLDRPASDELLARIAEKNNDPASAEDQLRQAIASSANSPGSHRAGAWINLAGFYAKQKKFPAMRQAIASGMAADTNHGSALVDGASLLIRHHQDLPQAEQMLRQYLASSHQSESTPSFQVHVQLAGLLARQGDKPGAQQEYTAARSLASDYPPLRQRPQ